MAMIYKINDRVQSADGKMTGTVIATRVENQGITLADVQWDDGHTISRNNYPSNLLPLGGSSTPQPSGRPGWLSTQGRIDLSQPAPTTESGMTIFGVPAWKVGAGVGGAGLLALILRWLFRSR